MFYLPPEAFDVETSCKVCGEVHSHKMAVPERSSPTNSDEYLEIEADIAEELSNAIEAKKEECDLAMEEAVAIGTELAIYDAIAQCEAEMDGVFGIAEAAVATAIATAVASGESLVSANILRGVPSRSQVIDGMIASTRYYTNEFFNTQVVPSLITEVRKVLDGTGTFAKPDFRSVQKVLDARLKSVPYWRVVANASASRSFHYGFLKAAQFQGFTSYRFEAVIDQRTSEICNHLDGTIWHLADAINLVERTAKAENAEEVKELMPWVKFDDIKELDQNALRDLGVMVPPLHGNCRSTIIPE